MSLESTLEKLRAKPLYVRKRMAFFGSFGITAVIFAFWLASFSVTGTPARGTVAKVVDKAGAPSQSLIAGVGGFFNDLKEMIFGAKKVTYTEVEVSAGER